MGNGIISATIQKNNGQIRSMLYSGFETVLGNIYYSMDGGSSFQTPGPCVFSVTTQTPDLLDLSFFQLYTGQPHVLDIDIHYVLNRRFGCLYLCSFEPSGKLCGNRCGRGKKGDIFSGNAEGECECTECPCRQWKPTTTSSTLIEEGL